ncbi:unnamed protein product [Linum tenue]|uniref:UPF3 domain-containing protein n=1 Tax=Linum tenue TaxID=586396 RepID=A0AAV0RHI2_9ROSI|nr:unnamed protein product [Linum tenue]
MSKENKVRTKVVVRHLPPTLSSSDLFSQFDHLFSDRYNWVSFRPGNTSRKSRNQRHSRAYIDFKSPGDVTEFAQFFNGHRFVNEKGAQFCAVVEYAPSQRVPKQCANDSREGTVLRDPDYLEFLKLIAKPVECVRSSEFQFERKEAEQSETLKGSIVVTPLMEFVRQKREAQYITKVHPKKPSGKEKVLINNAFGVEAKPPPSTQKERSQNTSTPRVRASPKTINKTADSRKKKTLQDKGKKHKTSLNHGNDSSEKLIKRILLSCESRQKEPLAAAYPQERYHQQQCENEKNQITPMGLGSTNISPRKKPHPTISGSDQNRITDNQSLKKATRSTEKRTRNKRKIDKPTLGVPSPGLPSNQQHVDKECNESHQLHANGAGGKVVSHEVAKVMKNDVSYASKAKGKSSKKGVGTGHPGLEKQVWVPKSSTAS